MNTGDPRDRALDAMLGRRGPSGPATAQCLDAETLAAYAEGGLSEPARADAEAHMGNCARCQSVMAAIVTSAGEVEQAPAQAPGRSWWPFDLRWLMPLAGAAAALVLWMVVPASGPSWRAVRSRRARVSRIEPAPTRSSPRLRGPHGMSRRLRLLRHPTALRQWRPFPPRLEPPRKRRPRRLPVGWPRGRIDGRARWRTLPSHVNEERRRQEADQLAKVEDRATPAAGLTSAAPAAPRESRGDEANRPASAPPPAAIEAFGTTDLRRSAPAGARTELRSLDPAVRWRLAEPGIIERSTNAGASWDWFDTGVRMPLSAGACPSASACWVVGNAGLVLLTTDARTWRPLTPPSSEDLVAVDATDAAAAVVRAAGGQRFRTTDAGATWTRVP